MQDRALLGFGLLSLALSLPAMGCDGASATGDGGAGGDGGSGAATSGSGGSSSVGVGGGGSGSGGSSVLGGPFRHGLNFGYVPGFSDQDMATLGRAVGADGARLSFPERHFAQWGYDIEVGDNEAYQQIGIQHNVAFLSSPIREHSTAPANVPDWQLEYYIPSHLYEPIFLQDGSVNPENYWAKYVEQTMATYKDYVKVYSVWNEPDWVADWQVTLDWDETPPGDDDLPRFNGSIFEYIRMLRITKEVAKKIDPELKVAVGGLGYQSFLGAILRYTDDPAGGAVSPDFPATGGAYFDVLDMHYYPIFGKGSSDTGVDGLVASRDKFVDELESAGAGPRPIIVTESGAPRVSVGGAPGGVEYARNYMIKVMVTAQAAGISGIDWFLLSDGTDLASSSFASMGCYESLEAAGSVGAAVRTPTGEAYRTLGALLEGAAFDETATAALALPSEVRGAAFVTADGKKAAVLWARATGDTEDATASYDLAASTTWNSYAWDAAKNGLAGAPLAPAGGKIALSLTSSPVFLIEQK